jgi:hypothetical protein
MGASSGPRWPARWRSERPRREEPTGSVAPGSWCSPAPYSQASCSLACSPSGSTPCCGSSWWSACRQADPRTGCYRLTGCHRRLQRPAPATAPRPERPERPGRRAGCGERPRREYGIPGGVAERRGSCHPGSRMRVRKPPNTLVCRIYCIAGGVDAVATRRVKVLAPHPPRRPRIDVDPPWSARRRAGLRAGPRDCPLPV